MGMRAALERPGVSPCTRSPGRGEHAIAIARRTGRAPLDLSLQLNRYPQIMLRAQPDVVHAHGGPGGVLIWKHLKVPLVYTAHHTYRQAHSRAFREALARGCGGAQLPAGCDGAPGVAFDGEFPAGDGRSGVAHRGAPQRCRPGRRARRVEHEGGRVLFVGRLEREKGVLEALSVLESLTRTDTGVRGVIVGAGSLEAGSASTLRRQAGGESSTSGSLDRDALNREYARAAVLLMPSRFEGLGMVALEAQSAGTPVVGYDVDGLRDAVGDGGVLVPPGNVVGDARRGGGTARRPRPATRGGQSRPSGGASPSTRGTRSPHVSRRSTLPPSTPEGHGAHLVRLDHMPALELHAPFAPAGDQPAAIEALNRGLTEGQREQVLLGVTGSGKTFTIANVIAQQQRPTLVLSPNKTLAAQLWAEFREFFPNNAVEYFVSYYDFYQPEAYIPRTDTYIEKDSSRNDEIDRLRNSATRALLTRRDVVVVASISCIYGIGSPENYLGESITVKRGESWRRDILLRKFSDLQYARNDMDFGRTRFRVRGDVVDVQPAYEEIATRVEFMGDTIESIKDFDPLTGEILTMREELTVFPASHYVTPQEQMNRALVDIEAELEERVKSSRRGAGCSRRSGCASAPTSTWR